MEFGMFHEFPSLPGRTEAEAFDEALAQVDAAEALGLDVMWLAELHFEPRRSVLSAPLSIASAIAARTRRIKIGIAVQVLPLCHPLRLAEEAATVDQLSHGRLIFGVGRSGVAQTYEAYGVSYAESRDRFREILD
ncbi:MAG TPA: LLM class flavin-dependent oxidoreductase, partial [Stellaceae bacterium]|nr:LLM class flavin-dependent oxidoreductase [Stellaceae bacterium]